MIRMTCVCPFVCASDILRKNSEILIRLGIMRRLVLLMDGIGPLPRHCPNGRYWNHLLQGFLNFRLALYYKYIHLSKWNYLNETPKASLSNNSTFLCLKWIKSGRYFLWPEIPKVMIFKRLVDLMPYILVNCKS